MLAGGAGAEELVVSVIVLGSLFAGGGGPWGVVVVLHKITVDICGEGGLECGSGRAVLGLEKAKLDDGVDGVFGDQDAEATEPLFFAAFVEGGAGG
jgi:hypothetical protein